MFISRGKKTINIPSSKFTSTSKLKLLFSLSHWLDGDSMASVPGGGGCDILCEVLGDIWWGLS